MTVNFFGLWVTLIFIHSKRLNCVWKLVSFSVSFFVCNNVIKNKLLNNDGELNFCTYVHIGWFYGCQTISTSVVSQHFSFPNLVLLSCIHTEHMLTLLVKSQTPFINLMVNIVLFVKYDVFIYKSIHNI